MKKMRGAALAVCLVALGCGGASPPELCEQVADAFGSAFARCGGDPVAFRQIFVDSAAGGSCNNILGIRDEDELQAQCLPWIRDVSCPELLAGDVDSSCVAQLER